MRKPNWKENNSNWGLSKLGNMEIIKNVLSDTLQIADPLINIFFPQRHKNIGGINYEEKNCNGDIGNLFIWNFSRL